MRVNVLVSLLLAVLGLAPPARANVAAQSRPPDPSGSVAVQSGTSIAVDREQLEIVCDEPGGEPRCRFTASYFLRNTGAAPADAVAGFWGAAENVSLQHGGRSDRVLSDAEIEGIARAFRALEAPPENMQKPTPVGIDLALGAGERSTLIARGNLPFGWAGGRGYETEAVYARHQLFQPSAPQSTKLVVSYYLAPIRSFRSVGPITVEIRHPSHWTPRVLLEATDGSTRELEPQDGRVTLDPQRAKLLHIYFDHSPTLHPGGPLFGIGGAFGNGGGFRLRGGWEIAAPAWLFHSITAETDASELFIVTPLIEATTPQVLIIPSLGFGVGMPVRIEPETAVGARLQATLSVFKLGAVASFDWFPRGNAGETETRWSLLGYVWL